MYKELMQDIDGFVPPDHGYLAGWAKQGERKELSAAVVDVW
jgi:uracil DNA glycosylase